MPRISKISAHQFMILILLYSVGTVILHTPAPLANMAKQDAWLATLLGTGIGLLLVGLYIKVGQLYPQLTLDRAVERAFGAWCGKLINLSFFFFTFSTAAEIIYYVGNFIQTYWMPHTPIAALNLLFASVVILAARLDIHQLVRSVEILFILFLILVGTLIITITPQINIGLIQPVLERGASPVIRATLMYVSVFTLSPIIFLMIFPSAVSNGKKAARAFYLGTLLGGIILIIVISLNLLVLGPNIVASITAPSYELAKHINIGKFLRRIEAIIAFTWLITTFIRTLIYFRVSVTVFANLFNINNYRPLCAPMGVCMLALSLIVFPNPQAVANFNTKIWLFYVATYGLVLPIVLLGAAKLRNAAK